MTFDDMWIEVRRKNPRLESGMARMPYGAFKRAMRYAYDKGHDHAGK